MGSKYAAEKSRSRKVEGLGLWERLFDECFDVAMDVFISCGNLVLEIEAIEGGQGGTCGRREEDTEVEVEGRSDEGKRERRRMEEAAEEVDRRVRDLGLG